MSECRCQIVGRLRDPYEPHIPSQPEWEQADDCTVHPLATPDPGWSPIATTIACDWCGECEWCLNYPPAAQTPERPGEVSD